MELCVSDYQSIGNVIMKATNPKGEELSTYGKQLSFYGKAKVFCMLNGDEVLVSYQTPVVLWVKENDTMVKLQKDDRYTNSPTTMRHINAFMTRHDCNGIGVKEWRKRLA